jgi:multidrug efflux pump subunit AcrA (membrane-fusion protein)
MSVAVIAKGNDAARVRALALEVVQIADTIADAPGDLPIVVIGDPATAATDPRVAYVARPSIDDDQLRGLLEAIASGVAAPVTKLPAETPQHARRAQRAFAASRRLASATDLRATESIACETVQELVGADRAYCLFFHAGDGSIWSEALQQGPGDERRAIGGLAGWAAYTGLPAHAQAAGEDPRWMASIDDPAGDAGCAVIVQPIVGADQQVHAVLIAVKARGSAFGEGEIEQLARFAVLASPLLDQLSSHVETQQVLDEDSAGQLFRAEAIAAAEPQRWGEVVRVSPTWLPIAYWVLVALLAGSAMFMTFGTIATYSTGMAVIRSTARTSITVSTAGNIQAVLVQPGDRIEAGAVIARLDDADQRAGVDRLTKEFETQLRNHMLDPNDVAADSSLRALRLQLDQARSALDERLIRARTGGTISDLRVQPGQHVEPGQVAASIIEGSGGLEVIALLPGEDRPQLSAGMQLRLELTGYRYAYQLLTIDSVSSEVIAASEARRILGPDVAEGLAIGGSVVVVRGRLTSNEFEADDQVYRYHDGMTGKAEVRLRSERIVFAVIPGLRRLE